MGRLEVERKDDLRKRYDTARANYLQPLSIDWDGDDRRWAYEAMLRAEMALKRFDVV